MRPTFLFISLELNFYFIYFLLADAIRYTFALALIQNGIEHNSGLHYTYLSAPPPPPYSIHFHLPAVVHNSAKGI